MFNLEKILHVLGRLDCGGAENLIMNIFRNIDRTKYQFDFVVHTTGECYFDKEILSLGGKIHSVPRYNVINHMEYQKWWDDFFSKNKYDIVHGHMTSTAFIYLKTARKYKIKTITHSHNISNGTGAQAKLKSYLEKKSPKYADIKLACSKNAGEWLYDSNDFKVIANGIETEKFTFNEDIRTKIREKYNIADKFVVCNVARFNEQKNHAFLIDIFAKIAIKNENARLMLVGDGELRSKIKEKIKTLDLEKK